ncbi:MAG TPA: R3H domain-containing nucleic acid-binding protein [Candidatus Bathyarchaeia archaeon]|nr:R3H domain-containing nucleic acid-binding protein [Candidatus Bathyarchaeia archaeon]
MAKIKKTIEGPSKPSPKDLKVIEKITAELLALMGFKDAKIKLGYEEESVKIDIDCADPGVLIGNHGEIISSLQLILSLMCYKKFGRWQRLIVNVDDWLDKRTEDLKNMALNTAQKVKFSGKEAVLPFLSSFERRIVHLTLADSPDVLTESVGEDNNRRLIIKAKVKNHG